MLDLVKNLLALIPATVCAVVAFFLSFAVSGALWFNLAAALGVFAVCLWLLRHRPGFTAAATACLLAVVLVPGIIDRLQPRPPAPTPALAGEIRRTAIPLATVDPDAAAADLQPLRAVWQESRMIALGEATHGTSEFFRMKDRLTRFLVKEMGVRHFAMEMDPEFGTRIESYIQGDSPIDPIRGWPWGTSEVTAMLDWMRRNNVGAPAAARVHFHGIDFQGQRRDFRMAQNTLDLLDQIGVHERVVLWAHNGHVSSAPGSMGYYLKRALGNQTYLTGFEFHHGSFTSNMNWVHTYQAAPADSRYYAAALALAGPPILFLDFRAMQQSPLVEAWLQQPHLSHSLQEMYGFLRLNPAWMVDNASWLTLYDGVIYIESSTPAHLL